MADTTTHSETVSGSRYGSAPVSLGAVRSSAAVCPGPTRLGRCVFGLVLILACAFTTPAMAADDSSTEDTKVIAKTVTGEISGVSPTGIAVEYSLVSSSSSEMFVPIDGKTRVEGVKSVRELQMGDTVKVDCQQTLRKGTDGKPVLLKTVASAIALVKRVSSETAQATPVVPVKDQ